MDIVTHALIGSVAAAGALESHPAFAVGLVAGNVVPDLDAFSRVAGKQAFLRFHQTYTHSVGAMGLVAGSALVLMVVGQPVWAELAFGLVTGMLMHVGLDLTNSYGVRCLWPFSSKRFALDWIFFIDAVILAYTLLAGVLIALFMSNEVGRAGGSIAYVVGLVCIVLVRAWLAKRARAKVCSSGLPAESISIIPTTWSPRKFLVCRDQGDRAWLSTLDGISGIETEDQSVSILDLGLSGKVTQSREWTTMRQLSSFFHAVKQEEASDGREVECRDLRIRNFNTRFGTLTVRLDEFDEVVSKKWEV
ncbi:metal-dependent hydrolase [Neorhodopirellula lusitana]|uniref:metal-dependent hydrolase n=1 Tax=Neorhodopirellula lusitana TaxID=445327 RepID=UPI00384E5757